MFCEILYKKFSFIKNIYKIKKMSVLHDLLHNDYVHICLCSIRKIQLGASCLQTLVNWLHVAVLSHFFIVLEKHIYVKNNLKYFL